MNENNDIIGWWAYLRVVLLRPIWTLLTTGVVVTVLYVSTWWRDNFGTDEWVKRLQLKNLLPHWQPAWWVSGGLCIVVFAVVKSSHDLFVERSRELVSMRNTLADRQFEPLAITAPQVRLIADSDPSMGPIDNLQLINVSASNVIFNIAFQPVRMDNGIFVTWIPCNVDVLEPGARILLRPLVLATKDGAPTGPCDSLSGVTALHQVIRSRSSASNAYDIGKIAFSCEDSAQQRYLVTLRAALNLLGNTLTVVDIDRVRIGSRPSAHTTT